MILSFSCIDTKLLFEEGNIAAKWQPVAKVAVRKLSMLHAAKRPEMLKIPPANRLEKLKGDRKGSYSIRINDRWRICFVFREGNAFDVEIVDYH